jgi:ABC-type branched-subunit amino acid transport system permease subunit
LRPEEIDGGLLRAEKVALDSREPSPEDCRGRQLAHPKEERMDPVAEPVGALTASLVFGALVLKLVDLVKYVRNGDWNGVLTLVLGLVAGIVAVQVMLLTQWGDEIRIGNETLDKLTFASQVVLGLVATSVAAVIYDFKKALDNTDSASTPVLQGGEMERERRERVEAALKPR